VESTLAALPHCRGDIADDDGAGAGITHQFGMLDSVQEGDRREPGFRDSDRMPRQGCVFQQTGGTDGSFLASADASV